MAISIRPYTIRPAGPADDPAIRAICDPHYATMGQTFVPDPAARWFVAERGGAVVGVLAVKDEGQVRWAIDLLGTDARAWDLLRQFLEKSALDDKLDLAAHVHISRLKRIKQMAKHGYAPEYLLLRKRIR
jgi:hypothetical protein